MFKHKHVPHVHTHAHLARISHIRICVPDTLSTHCWPKWHQWSLPIPLNAWFWRGFGRGKDPCIPACTCTCITWIAPEAGLRHLIYTLASHGSKSSLLSHLEKWATETPGPLQLQLHSSHTFTPTAIPGADIQTHINTPELRIEGSERAETTVLTTWYEQMCGEQPATSLHVPFITF